MCSGLEFGVYGFGSGLLDFELGARGLWGLWGLGPRASDSEA